MALTASKVVAGMAILASHINKIIDDILSHTHASGEGGTVAHSSLSDGSITSTYLNHVDLNKHVQGTGTTEHGADSPGGSQGVHGHNASTYMMGSLGGQYVIQTGVDTLSAGTKHITFSPQFTTIVSALATLASPKSGDDHYPSDIYIQNLLATGMDVKHSVSSFQGATFYWMAIGTKSK
jgi:hypothetical protein